MSGGFSHTDIVGAVGQAGDFGAAASRPCGSAGFLILHRGIDAGNFTVVVAAVCAGNGSHAGSRRAIRLLNSGSRRTDDGAAFHTAGDRHGDGLANVVLDQFVGAVGRARNVCAVSLPLIRECAGVAGDRRGYGSQDLVVLRCTRDAGRAAQRTGRSLMHELEDGFVAGCVVIAAIVLIGTIVGALFAFRVGAESHLAADHGARLIARRGERHRAAAGKVDFIRRVAFCLNNEIPGIIQCQINNRIRDEQLALFNICCESLCAYLDGAVLNNQIAAISCINSYTV